MQVITQRELTHLSYNPSWVNSCRLYFNLPSM